MSGTKRGWRKRFFHGCKSLCSYAEAHFGSGTKLTVLGKKTCSETTSQSFCHRFKCMFRLWAILRLHLWNTLFDGSGTKCTDLKVWKKFLQKLVCVSKVKTSHGLFFCKKCCSDKKKLALGPDYFSHMELWSGLWDTVSFQSEAYFGPGTKLTVLGKKWKIIWYIYINTVYLKGSSAKYIELYVFCLIYALKWTLNQQFNSVETRFSLVRAFPLKEM